MSEEAFKIYEETLREQHSRNEARRIRARVAEARGSIPSAGPRWPFELLQNALDAGPRDGNTSVAIHLSCEQERVAFEHDGAPFTSQDLAALLSGGSSKDFESDVTTGRFGTGFLVTHVLAERTLLQGLLVTPDGHEKFDLLLDRGGDEDEILQNMTDCTEAIRVANPVTRLEGVASAKFEYRIQDENPLILGTKSLRAALPNLYATRRSLGRVELEDSDGAVESWTPTDVIERDFENSLVEERSLRVQKDDYDLLESRVFRFTKDSQASASTVVLVQRTENGWKVIPPEPNAPRIYREYPLSRSGFLPTNFILDGKFEPDQERSRLLMTNQDKELVSDAFDAAVTAVKYAFANKWEDAHLLVQVFEPTNAFDVSDVEEKTWWSGQLKSFAERVAALPIVECPTQTLPALGAVPYADFVVPRLLADSIGYETTVERMWPLVDAVTSLCPPKLELAAIWTEIAEGWHSLGVPVNRISVKSLTDWVKEGAKTLDNLEIDGDVTQWLKLLLDVTGECWKSRSGVDTSALQGILPDQNHYLRSPSDLSRDGGVPESLKETARDIGIDIRNELLLHSLQSDVEENKYLRYVLETALPNVISEDAVIERVVDSLDSQLPEDEPCDDTSIELREGNVRLLQHLWKSKSEEARSIARRVPLITHSGNAGRWSPTRMMMAPIASWHESAQPFSGAYPPNRILSELYLGNSSKNIPSCVEALIGWRIAFPDPIAKDAPSELTERRLAELSQIDTSGVTVNGNTQEFSQVALLQPELLNRCSVGIEEAHALLGLLLCHIAPHDPRWQTTQVVSGRRAGQSLELSVAGALWLADLKIRPWVPVRGEDDKLTPMPANMTTLQSILDPGWLHHNDAAIRLLTQWFGFDQLELRLLGIEPDPERREHLRNGLASLVEYGGSNPEFYSTLVEEVEARQRRSRDVDRFRRLGLGVQEAVKIALESHNLKVDLVDRGFDYEVSVITDDTLGDVSARLTVGPYLLEVKATTKGNVRLTPTQAATARDEAHRYVLCVVDLRECSEEELETEWSASMVEPIMKLVPNIGFQVEGTYSLVEAAKTRAIAVRNDTALRYEVPSSVWELGMPVGEWVSEIQF